MTNSSQASAATFGGQASAIYNTGSATLPANTNLFGSIGSVLMAGTGSVPAAAGVAGFVIRQNTNTIDSASGGVFGFQNYVGSGTTGTVTGVTIAQPISTAGHTITNTFGIYIADQTNTAGTQTNTPYAIYQAGSSNYNYFAGNVGVGDASPNSLFTVGSGDLFQINSSGQIGSQQAPVSDYLFALAGTTGNDNSRIIDITQANNATEDSNVINIVNTANPGTISTAITRSIQNITSSLTPTATVNGASASLVLNVYGSDSSVSLGSVTVADVTGANSADIAASSMRGTLTFDPIINDTGSTGISTLLGYGTYSSVTGAPTLTSVTGPTSAGTYGGYFSNTASSAGNANLTYSAIGIQASALGDLTTTGSTEHYGALILSTGTADTNYGIYADVSGATNNYAAILTGGNVGIGDTSPAALFTVGSGDLFQVNSSGAIAAATGITSSGTITFSGLGGSGTKCVQTDNAGVITAAASACGSGSGITIGTTAITSGSSGRILYDNAGVVGEMTTSGSGTVVALATTPTFTTNITTPIVNGSTSADGTLTIQGNNTTGNTSTSANLVFKVGDSAGTTAMTILNSGSVGIGTTGADRTLDILDASNPQIRLTTTDGSVYSDLQNSANINLAISGNTLSSSSARQYGLQINPTFNQSSTAGYTAFQVNSTETATGSAMNRLVDLQVGGSTKFAVRNDGSLTLQDTAYITTPYGGFGKFQKFL
jgi:hypothetical protein